MNARIGCALQAVRNHFVVLREAVRQRSRILMELETDTCPDDENQVAHAADVFGGLVYVMHVHVGSLWAVSHNEEDFVAKLVLVDWHERTHIHIHQAGVDREDGWEEGILSLEPVVMACNFDATSPESVSLKANAFTPSTA